MSATVTSTLPAVTDATFATEVAPGTGHVAVEFSAAWCAPCRLMAPVVEAVAHDYAPRLRVLQLDADANPATMARLGVRGLPTMLVFRDGELVERIVGAVPAAALRGRLDRVLAG
jgi:thioredoxin 1